MEIIKTSRTLTGAERYKLTSDAKGQNMSAAEGQELELNCWAIFNETDSEGNTKKVFALMTTEGDVFRTISEPFIKEFEKMIVCFEEDGEDVPPITVVKGQTKKGRDFITCALA